MNELWGNSWGLIISSRVNFEQLLKHLRRFLIVKTEKGQKLYFRFYDPRVLRQFLPTCDEQQLKEFFGPIEKFICEDETQDYGLVFSLDNDSLKIDRLLKEEVFDASDEIKPHNGHFT